MIPSNVAPAGYFVRWDENPALGATLSCERNWRESKRERVSFTKQLNSTTVSGTHAQLLKRMKEEKRKRKENKGGAKRLLGGRAISFACVIF
jgi:hypothetical protein